MAKLLGSEKQRMAVTAAASARPRPSGWWRADCPFCAVRRGKADTAGSFAVKVATGVYVCMRCGVSGKLDRLPTWGDADENEKALTELEKSAKKAPPNFYPLWGVEAETSETLREPLAYVRGRGLTDAMIKQAGIGVCLSGTASGRIVVPVLDSDGESWLGWVGRDYTKLASYKYKTAPGMRRERILYNHAALFAGGDSADEPVYIVEGAFDALFLWPDGVALFGMATEEQINMISATKRPVAVVLDGDAHDAGWGLSQRLRLNGARAGYIKLPPTLDPDQVEKAWLYEEARSCWSRP